MSATNTTVHGLSLYALGDVQDMDDANRDNGIIEQGLQKIDDHIDNHDNPHGVDAEQIGLGKVDNTSDNEKPVSIPQQVALNTLDAKKIDKIDIVNDLTTGGGTVPASAETVKTLKAEVDKKVEQQAGKGLSSNDYTNEDKAKVGEIDDKVNRIDGKDLSTNDFDNYYKEKLDGLDKSLAEKADQPYQQHIQTDGSWFAADSAGGLVKAASIFGNGKQSKLGQNILPYPYTGNTKTVNGITFTSYSDGTILVNGTASSNNPQFDMKSAASNFKLKAGTYTVNGCPAGGSSSTYFIGVDAYIGMTYVDSGGRSDIGNGYTFTISESDAQTYNYRVLIYVAISDLF